MSNEINDKEKRVTASVRKEEKFSCRSFLNVIKDLAPAALRVNGHFVGTKWEIEEESLQCKKLANGNIEASLVNASSDVDHVRLLEGEWERRHTITKTKTKMELTPGARASFSFHKTRGAYCDIFDPKAIVDQQHTSASEYSILPPVRL